MCVPRTLPGLKPTRQIQFECHHFLTTDMLSISMLIQTYPSTLRCKLPLAQNFCSSVGANVPYQPYSRMTAFETKFKLLKHSTAKLSTYNANVSKCHAKESIDGFVF